MRLEPIDSQQLLTGEITPTETTPIKYQKYRTNESGLVIIDKNEDLSFSRNFLPLYTKTYNKTSFDTVVKNEFEEFVTTSGNTPIAFLQSQLTELQSQRDSLLATRDSDRNKISELTNTISDLQRQIDDILNSQNSNTEQPLNDFKSIFAVTSDQTQRFSLICLLYQNELYPIIEGENSRIADACVEILRLNGKQVTGVSGTVLNSYLSNRIPDVAVYKENPAAGRNAETLTSFNSVRYLGIEDIKKLVSGDFTPFTENN